MGAKNTGSLNVNFSNCSITGTVPVYNNGDVAGLLSSCIDECKVMEDITIDKSIKLRACIKGNDYSITCSEKTPVAIYINNSKTPITIDGLVIKKLIPPGTINQNYSINSTNSSNITIKNSTVEGRIRFANKTKSDSPNDISQNITIIDSRLYADFSDCPQGWEYGQDHLAFYSIKKVRIENCEIVSKNVNRVLKTSAYFTDTNYDHPQNCTENVLFKNNQVQSESGWGKQFWDMYCGTVNATISDNIVNLNGFTRFVENKAYQVKYKDDRPISSVIIISNNVVNMVCGNLFQFHANSDYDKFVVQGNRFRLGGSNRNSVSDNNRSTGIQLQGYNSCSLIDNVFEWVDEAEGMSFASINFRSGTTSVIGNSFINAGLITVSKANHMSHAIIPTVCDSIEISGNFFTGKAVTNQKDSPIVTTDCEIKLLTVHDNSGLQTQGLVKQGRGAIIRHLRLESPAK